MDQPIYLDHNATTPMLLPVVEAMSEAMRAGYANPASQHGAGRRARRVVEDAREQIIRLLGGDTSGRQPDRLIFTSGGTEANNLALFGLAGSPVGAAKRLVTTGIEHPSIAAAADELARRGWQIERLPVDRSGVVDPQSLAPLLEQPSSMVSVMLGNNETGAIQPVGELATLATAAGVPMHTDAVQVVGKLAVDFRTLGVDLLSFTAHKLHGPLGIGALLLRGETPLAPQLFGGFQQAGLRPGTESAPLVVGMLTALECWHAEQAARREHLAKLRDRFEQQITAGCPQVVVVSKDTERLPHTSNLAFVGFDRQALFLALDMEQVACSTGSACASGSSEPSPVLLSMGLPEEQIGGSLRFSFATETTLAEVDEAVRRILLVCKRLEQQNTLRK
ncbi:cysteine desulfurase family protein [Aeoliella mucimassa]|uniref:cysteine desulfurase n=1 Tax=Aeoliella mucimassa TaxID=2527972 RepID=A0A518AWS5_9BACT|nr:cysteine desulfurase family protein [Aeoliella mucimassa]QDU59173.1 Cysteine desulfurase [Aeoliella mucimassa]